MLEFNDHFSYQCGTKNGTNLRLDITVTSR